MVVFKVIETVGEAIDFLNQFPREMRIVKSETFADGYTEIFSCSAPLCIAETDGLIVGDKVIIDSTQMHFRDAQGNTVGSFHAVVL